MYLSCSFPVTGAFASLDISIKAFLCRFSTLFMNFSISFTLCSSFDMSSLILRIFIRDLSTTSAALGSVTIGKPEVSPRMHKPRIPLSFPSPRRSPAAPTIYPTLSPAEKSIFVPLYFFRSSLWVKAPMASGSFSSSPVARPPRVITSLQPNDFAKSRISLQTS